MALKDLLIAARLAIVANNDITVSGVHLFENDNQDKYTKDDFPFIVIDGVSGGASEIDTGRTDQVEEFEISFKTFSKDVKNCLDIGNEIQKMFIVSKLSLNSGTVLCTQKFSETTDLDPDKDIGGKNVYMNIVVISFMVNFNLT